MYNNNPQQCLDYSCQWLPSSISIPQQASINKGSWSRQMSDKDKAEKAAIARRRVQEELVSTEQSCMYYVEPLLAHEPEPEPEPLV
jgi:hypothetical protein